MCAVFLAEASNKSERPTLGGEVKAKFLRGTHSEQKRTYTDINLTPPIVGTLNMNILQKRVGADPK